MCQSRPGVSPRRHISRRTPHRPRTHHTHTHTHAHAGCLLRILLLFVRYVKRMLCSLAGVRDARTYPPGRRVQYVYFSIIRPARVRSPLGRGARRFRKTHTVLHAYSSGRPYYVVDKNDVRNDSHGSKVRFDTPVRLLGIDCVSVRFRCPRRSQTDHSDSSLDFARAHRPDTFLFIHVRVV